MKQGRDRGVRLHVLVRLSFVAFWQATEKVNELPSEYADASGEWESVRIAHLEQMSALG